MYDGTGETRKHYPRMAEIKEVVARHNGLTVADLESACRKKTLAWPRQIAQYLCRTMTVCSYPEIGRVFGDRDHTSILFAFRKVEHLLKTQADLAQAIAVYEAEINAIMRRRVEADQGNALQFAPRQMVVRSRLRHRLWTDAELAALEAAASNGATAKTIAPDFPERSFYAVKEKLRAVRMQAEAVS